MFEFFDNSEEYGNKEISVTLRNNEVFRKEDVKYVLLDEPKLEITNIDFPESIGYDKDFDINVEINKVSFSDPENIKFVLKSGRISRKQEIDITKTNIYMNFKDISSNRLKSGNNNINVFVYYEDKEGNKFVEEQKINIKLSNLSGWQKFKLFWIRLLRLY